MATSNLGVSAASGDSGIDVQGLVDQVIYSESAPVRQLQAQQTQFNAQTSALNDINSKLATLLTKINALKDLAGQFNAQLANSSSTSVLSATADGTAAVGAHTVVVSNLATISSYYTDPLASGSTTFTAGSFDLQVGTGTPATITVDATRNTLDGLASYINSQNYGVQASVVTDASGARLALVSATSGAAGDLTLSNDTTGLTFTKAVTGINASLTVDSIPISSATNTINSVISGVTLNLLSAAPLSPVTVKIDPDTTKAKDAVKQFVANYNAVASAINAQFAYDSTTKRSGALAGNSSLRLAQAQLMTAVTYSITGNNGIESLGSLGVNLQNDGTLVVDDTTLDGVLASNYKDAQNFFQSLTPAGFARNLSTTLSDLTDSTLGPLNVELTGISRSQSAITNQIGGYQDRLATRRQQLVEQFSRVDTMLRQLPLLLNQINSQLGAIR
jgi:flagellar hook-associated protein 2